MDNHYLKYLETVLLLAGELKRELDRCDGYNIWASEIYTENPKAIIIYWSGIQQPSVTYYCGHAKWMQDNGYASFKYPPAPPFRPPGCGAVFH